MSSLDSRAAFKARALELNLPEDLITKLAAINVDTFGALAFIGPLQAGTTDEGPLISTLKRALGSAPDDGVLSIALAEMRGKVKRTDASEPQRMPLAERTQRIAALQKRLVGIRWTVDIEPSHKLQDSVAQMVTDQSLVWIPWDRLTSRSLEITAEKLDPSVSFDSSGNLKLIKRSADPSCNTTGEYAVKLALQRRSLAFELGRICRYETLVELCPFAPTARTPLKLLWLSNGKGRHQKQTGKDIKKDHPNAEKPPSTDGDKKKTWTVPAGCHSRDNDGKPLCFSFNLKGCNFCKPGKRCRRGRHLCWNVVTPFFKDDETGGERLAAEELARELLQGGGVWVESPDGDTPYMHHGRALTGEWRFSTAEEAEYPAELCQEVAHLLATSAGLPPLRLYNKLNQMEKELRCEEARLHSTLPDHAREVVKGKNLLLWAKLLEETSSPDKGVFELMKGVDLVGKPDKSPLFETKDVPAKSSEALLLESAKWRRERLKSRDPHKGDAEATQQLWECTLKDRDNGFLCGPFYDEESVKQHLGVDEFVCSRRFVIEQGTPEKLKLRPINNYKEGGVNEAYHSVEKLALFDTDWMLAMATYIARVSDSASCIEIVLSTGETLRGELHPFWK
ncbi:unnamed protein product, partial [Symbiodinium microadriaticum]